MNKFPPDQPFFSRKRKMLYVALALGNLNDSLRCVDVIWSSDLCLCRLSHCMLGGDNNVSHKQEIPQGALRSRVVRGNLGSTTCLRMTTHAKEMWETYKISRGFLIG